tara:strand:- start:1197 stop:3455 length:2259 start_codon:yes stop_codon:yes gene_type:complete
MARVTKKNKAQVNKQIWDKANSSHRQRWQTTSQKGYDFYLNEQLTKEEVTMLEESGMPTFTINRITPIIEIMKYFVTANNPKWKAVGATGDDADVAQVHSDIADYCWYLSNGKSLYSQIALDSLTKGVGYFLIDIDKDADRGMGEVRFNRINPYDVYVDPSSQDFLYRDANFIQIRKNISRSRLINLFPEYQTKIKKVTKGTDVISYSQRDADFTDSIQREDITFGVNAESEDDDIIPYYETYSKKKFKYRNVYIKIEPSEAQLLMLKEQVQEELETFKQEIEVQLIEKQMQIERQVQEGEVIPQRGKLMIENSQKMAAQGIREREMELISQAREEATIIKEQVLSESQYRQFEQNEDFKKNIVDSIEFYENRIVKTCSAGDDTFLFEQVIPISEYPIIPIPYMYTGSPFPMSAVTPLIGKQQEINKAHQIMLHNANLSSNLRWMYEEGSVPEDEWEKYSSAPGALLKYRQGFSPPTAIQPAPINNAFFTVVQQGKTDAEYISGVPSAMMGFSQDQAETYRGLLANDEFGTRRLKAWMNSIVEPSLEHVGKVFQMMAQKHYNIEKVFRIVQPNSDNNNEEKEVRINVSLYNDYGKAIGKYKDYASARFDVRIIAGATLPLNRWALLEEYFKWYQSGLIDDVAMLSETDIRNKEKIMERKSMVSQAQSQLQSMQEMVKEKDGTIETLQRQLVQAGIKMKVGDANNEIRKDVLQTEAQQKYLRQMLKAEFDKMKEQLVEDKKSTKKDISQNEQS